MMVMSETAVPVAPAENRHSRRIGLRSIAQGPVDPRVIDPRVVGTRLIDPGVIDPGVVGTRLIDPGVIDLGVIDPGFVVTIDLVVVVVVLQAAKWDAAFQPMENCSQRAMTTSVRLTSVRAVVRGVCGEPRHVVLPVERMPVGRPDHPLMTRCARQPACRLLDLLSPVGPPTPSGASRDHAETDGWVAREGPTPPRAGTVIAENFDLVMVFVTVFAIVRQGDRRGTAAVLGCQRLGLPNAALHLVPPRRRPDGTQAGPDRRDQVTGAVRSSRSSSTMSLSIPV